jgi:NADH-quinone oxidoreductase subunit N
MLIGMAFKMGAAPFHFWMADVYTGAPTIVTAFMSTVVKTAAVAAFFRLFFNCFEGLNSFWAMTLVIISALTMFIGNITAVAQSSFKRMLAYSSIAHAGYLLLAVFTMTTTSGNAILLYSTAYVFAGILAFSGLMIVQHFSGSDNFEAFNGLSKRNPFLALCITAAMLSMSGIPPMAGFFGKFYIFSTALSQNYIWIVIWSVLMSCVGIYYYFKVIIAMYMKPCADEKPYPLSSTQQLVMITALLASLIFGLAPGILTGLI